MAMTGIAAAALALVFAYLPQAAPPHVVSTNPEQGAQLTQGRTTIRVTFSRPMKRGSYSFVALDPVTYPDCATTPRQSSDNRSFELDCTLKPGRSYAIGFNHGRFRNFTSMDGVPAEGMVLRFTTL